MHTNFTNIHRLLEGCRKNERQSQQQLYNLLKGFAMQVCYRYVNSSQEAEEIMNESFVKLFLHIHQFEENRHPETEVALKGWFRRITVNTCIDHLRKTASFVNGHTISHNHESIADHTESGLDKLSYKEIIDCILDLTPAYRTVFNLFVIEGYGHDEIARQLNISVGASKSNLSKARENLRKIVIKKLHPEIHVESR